MQLERRIRLIVDMITPTLGSVLFGLSMSHSLPRHRLRQSPKATLPSHCEEYFQKLKMYAFNASYRLSSLLYNTLGVWGTITQECHHQGGLMIRSIGLTKTNTYIEHKGTGTLVPEDNKSNYWEGHGGGGEHWKQTRARMSIHAQCFGSWLPIVSLVTMAANLNSNQGFSRKILTVPREVFGIETKLRRFLKFSVNIKVNSCELSINQA